MSYAYLCQTCDGWASWRVTREGDVITTWACNRHLDRVCLDLQKTRDTQLFVTLNTLHPATSVVRD